MLKRFVSVMITAGALVGCGTPTMAPVSGTAAPRLQAATSTLVLTGGSQVLDTPKDSLPIRLTITVSGTRAGKPFNVVVKTFNARHFYVPTAQRVTVNGTPVPPSGWRALDDDLWRATKSTPEATHYSGLAGATMRFSAPASSEAGATGTRP